MGEWKRSYISAPGRMPPSKPIVSLPLTTSTMPGRASRIPIAPSTWRPPCWCLLALLWAITPYLHTHITHDDPIQFVFDCQHRIFDTLHTLDHNWSIPILPQLVHIPPYWAYPSTCCNCMIQ